jgi:hypothetical protein
MIAYGILEKASGKKRDKVYIYGKYLDVLEDGAGKNQR